MENLRETKIRRGGIDSTHYTGKGPEGNSRFFKRTDNPNVKGLIERTYLDYFKVQCDTKNCNGAILWVEVVFLKATEYPNGEVQTETAKEIRYFSEWNDIKDFVNAYPGIPLHLLNGLESGGEGHYGLKPFRPDGSDADADYTQAQKDAPPTKLHKGYHGVPGTNGPIAPTEPV